MGYDAAGWSDLFVAVAGAAAALAGLVFVAVSINLDRILTAPTLTTRAAETLAILVALLLLSVFGLVPDQPPEVFGAELLGLGLLLGGASVRARSRMPGTTDLVARHSAVRGLVTTLFCAVPCLIAGASTLAGAGGGLYWLVPTVAFGFAGAAGNAWVFLVEILR